MRRHLRQVGALAATAWALLPPQGAGAWTVERLRAGVSRAFDAPTSMIQSQWGSSYYPLEAKTNEDGSFEYLFATVVEGAVGSVIATGPENMCAAVGMTSHNVEPFQKLEGITSADQCQRACGNTMKCNNAIFSDPDSTCHLMEKLPGVTIDPNKAIVLPNCDSTCFKSGQKLSGEERSLGKAPNPSICQARCQSEPNCKGFTWTRSTSACTSYNNDSDLAPNDDAVSGPRQGCLSNAKSPDYAGSCSVRELSDTGTPNFVERGGILSYKQCHALCLNHANCWWLTYNEKDRMCYLKEGRKVLKFVKSGDVTGPRLCDSSCFQKDIELRGEPIATVENEMNPTFCHSSCSLNEACHMWSWNRGSKKCLLYGAGKELLGTLAEGSWSGIRGACGDEEQVAVSDKTIDLGNNNSCAAVNTGSSSTDSDVLLSVQNVMKADDCQRVCSNAGRCIAAIFDMTNSTCELMKRLGEMKPASGRAVIMPNCESGCFSIGKKLRGEGSSLGSAFSPNICQARCQSEPNCKGFTWISTTMACISHDGSSLDFEAHTDAVSGPRLSCSPHTKLPDHAGPCAIREQSGTGFAELKVTERVFNIADCQAMCMGHPKCNWWTYNSIDRRCYLKPGPGIIKFVKAGDTTGPRVCNSSCYQQDIHMFGKTIDLYQGYENPYSCHYGCRADSRCQNWSWKQPNLCYLYSSSGVPSGQVSKGRWSGDREECGN